jgi:hypothetical protein
VCTPYLRAALFGDHTAPPPTSMNPGQYEILDTDVLAQRAAAGTPSGSRARKLPLPRARSLLSGR